MMFGGKEKLVDVLRFLENGAYSGRLDAKTALAVALKILDDLPDDQRIEVVLAMSGKQEPNNRGPRLQTDRTRFRDILNAPIHSIWDVEVVPN